MTTKLPLIGLLTAAIITTVVGLSVPKINYQPHGIFLPAKTDQSYAALPASTVLVLNQYPLAFEKLGEISIERHFLGENKKTVNSIVDYAKTIAAKHGATAIVVQRFFADRPAGVESGLPSYSFLATAIRTTPRSI